MKKPSLHIFQIFFLLSGMSALIFEVIWQRSMILAFGASAPAITAILTAVLCGIAFGSLAGGKIVKKYNNLFELYAYVQLWIFVWGTSVPLLLRFADAFQLVISNMLPQGGVSFFAVRFIMAISVVLPATLGMGATLPIMNRIIFNDNKVAGSSIALAYGMNTLGSVLGCLFAGLVLIPNFGILRTSFIAGSLNLVIFILILYVLKPKSLIEDEGLHKKININKQNVAKDKHPYSKLMIILYALGGFLSLGYEITWFRLLGIFGENNIITFTVGLAVYLLGFSLGSLFLYPKFLQRFSAFRIFFLSNWGVGAVVIFLLPFYYIFPDLNTPEFFQKFEYFNNVFPVFVAKETVTAIVLMLLPTMFMGLSYPSVCHIAIGEKDELGQKSGFIYFLGTIGASLGALVVGQGLIPRLNLMGTIAFLCTASLIISLIVLCFETKRFYFKWDFFMKCSLLLILTVLCYGRFGYPFIKMGKLQKKGDCWVYKNQLRGVDISLISYKTGPSGTVSVQHAEGIEEGPVRMLLVDGQPVASTERWSQLDAKVLAHIPLMLHPDPRNAITVGYGAGVTSWSMTQYGIDTDCVEIEPEVYRATNLFSDHNHFVDKLPNFHIIIDDARNYFHLTSKKYDVISTDVTNLNYKNNSSLYTRDYFEILRSKLAENGIASAWVPMGGVSSYDFKILLKTFQDVFPHTSVWFIGKSSTSYFAVLVGTPNVLSINYGQVKSLFKRDALNKDLKEVGVLDPLRLLSFLLLDEVAVKEYTKGYPFHTDDFPILEFHPMTDFMPMVDLDEIYQHIDFNPLKYITNLRPEEKNILERFFAGEEVMCNDSGECKVM